MNLKKVEIIVELLLVVFLIFIKIFVFLPNQVDLDFKIGWFVFLSFMIIPVIITFFKIGKHLRRFIYSDNWISFQQMINTIFGIPLTIFCVIASIYALSLERSDTWFSVLFMTYPLIAFSLYISIKEIE